jgi:PhoPQ-activated pathogenicity-related protein
VVPMVIDTLNMKPQMMHQVECFGKPSDMVHDYVERKLIPMPPTEEAKRLWSMVDPYFYRDKLKMPKLIINGANDPYWTVDALNIYWNDLPGDKYVCIVPNAGHDLVEMPEKGIPNILTSRQRVLNSTSAFAKLQIAGKSLPKLAWEHTNTPEGKLCLNVNCSIPPKGARLWVATSETKDFRKSRWRDQPAEVGADGKVTGTVASPAKGFLAVYGEVDFDAEGLPYTLSTQVRVVSAP